MPKIREALRDPIEALAQCNEHLAYAGQFDLPFMLVPYRTQRSLLFQCLDVLPLQSNSQDRAVLVALAWLQGFWNARRECLLLTDTVEIFVVRRPSTTSEKIDLSDRLTNRSRASTKGKTTLKSWVKTTVTDFFNSIDRQRPHEPAAGLVAGEVEARGVPARPGQPDAAPDPYRPFA